MKPVVEVAGARVFLGDCRDVLRALPDNSVDSIVTDPPYELGFMGKKWDNSGIAYDVTVWEECLRVLKPGGHVLAFGGSRTWHRLAVAVEDAGFELRDSIAWIYGSGFPKSLDVSKAIEAKIVTGSSSPKGQRIAAMGDDYKETPLAGSPDYGVRGNFSNKDTGNPGMTITTSEAKTWQGWGTALKPAFEPVVVGRKPLVGTVAENVLAWGVGGLNIDGSRIGAEGGTRKENSAKNPSQNAYGNGLNGGRVASINAGRWPANVILDEVTAGLLDEQSGERKGMRTQRNSAGMKVYGGNSLNESKTEFPAVREGYNDTGGASRFFYVAKASKRDRNEGLEELEENDSMKWSGGNEGQGVGAFYPDGTPRPSQKSQNFHPTVKPTQLMRYLIKLVTPAGGTVLDPFTGSGSTGKAALLDGFDFVGAELTEEYLPIIEGRLRWASEQEAEIDDTLF
jgi:DNA modification methylase